MMHAGLPSTLEGTAVNNFTQILLVLQMCAQIQHDRDFIKLQYQIAKFQLSQEEDRCRKEHMRRITAENQMNEHIVALQGKTLVAMETAAEVQRLLEETKEELDFAHEQAGRFKELSGKKDGLLSKLKDNVKVWENYVQTAIENTKLIQHLDESRKGHLQCALEHSKLLEKKLLEVMEKANHFQREAEERERKVDVTERELQSAKDQIKDLQEAFLIANQNGASCEAKNQMTVQEVVNLKNMMKADKEVLVQTWVKGNATVEHLQVALEKQKTNSKRDKKRIFHLLQEKEKLQEELQLERNRSTLLQFILAQNTTDFTNLNNIITAYSDNQVICHEEKQDLLKKFQDEKQRCEERNSVMSQKIMDVLQQLNTTTNANSQIHEHVKQTLLAALENERRLRASLLSSFSSNCSSQIQHPEAALQRLHLNIKPKVNPKKLSNILNGRTMMEAFLSAIRKGNVTELEVLLDAGADIESYNEYGNTPLMVAATYGQVEVARLLLERGANVNAKAPENKNWMALQAAVANNRIDIVKLLLENGADVNAKDGYGRTAADGANNDAIKTLLKNRSGKS